MDKATDQAGKAMHRRLSGLKVVCRLLEDELDLAKAGKDVVLSRDLTESLLDSLELYVEDFESAFALNGSGERRGGGAAERVAGGDSKPQVTRLN